MLNEMCDGRCNSTANSFILVELSASTHNYSTRANCYTMKWLLVNEHVIRSASTFSPTVSSKNKGFETEQEIIHDISVRGWGCAKSHKASNLVLFGKTPFRLQHTVGRAVKSSSTGPDFSGLQFRHDVYKMNICLYFNLVSPTQKYV